MEKNVQKIRYALPTAHEVALIKKHTKICGMNRWNNIGDSLQTWNLSASKYVGTGSVSDSKRRGKR